MERDVRIDTEEKGFKYRVCGVVIKDGKLLTQRSEKNNFYFLPGGHVELGEDTQMAVIREMKEETLVEYNVDELMVINENFFMHESKKYHELGFYYKLSPQKDMITENYSRIEIDKGKEKKLVFEWIEIQSLNSIDFRPSFLKEKIMNNNYKLEHIITKEI